MDMCTYLLLALIPFSHAQNSDSQCKTEIQVAFSSYPPKTYDAVQVNFINILNDPVELLMVPYNHECCRDKRFSYHNISARGEVLRKTYPGNKWYALNQKTGVPVRITARCMYEVGDDKIQVANIGQNAVYTVNSVTPPKEGSGITIGTGPTQGSTVSTNTGKQSSGIPPEALYAIPVVGIILIILACAVVRIIKQKQKERARLEALNPKPPKIGAKPKEPPPKPKEDKKKAGKVRSGGGAGARGGARNRSRGAAAAAARRQAR